MLIVIFLVLQTLAVRAEPPGSRDIQWLFNNICTKVFHIRTRGMREEPGLVIENYILSFNGWDRSMPDYRALVSRFLNENGAEFVCANNTEIYPPQHFYKRVVNIQMYNQVLMDFFLQADANENSLYGLDFNVVEFGDDGEGETLLDYLDAILARPDVDENYDAGEIRELRETLVLFYGAKNARDLQ